MEHVEPTTAFRLDDRVAVVTGASSGLGERFARVLDAAGARVVVAARRAERIEKVAAELRAALPVACDLSTRGGRQRLVDAVAEHHGRADVLVNNAGLTRVVPALDETDEDFTSVLAIDLVAPFALCRDFGGLMHDGGGGSIVNVSSVLGMVGVGQIPQSGYAAAKGGLVNLTRELAAQWARSGVRVNALAPGWFPTEMTGDMFEDERSLDWIARRTPMGRGGEPHELDGAVLFLASGASSYVTGHVLAVDGGWTAI